MNREQWLTESVVALKAAFFEPRTLSFENEIRISTGWCRGSKKAIGQCWSAEVSAGKFSEIFISPELENSVEVLATVLHEMIHAHLGLDKKHGKEFKSLVKEFGLSGKVTSTFAAESSPLFEQLFEIGRKIGQFPHSKLNPRNKEVPKGLPKKGNWVRFKSKTHESYRVMVSPKSLLEFGIPKDQNGEELVPTDWIEEREED